MPVKFVADADASALPVHLTTKAKLGGLDLSAAARHWIEANAYEAAGGKLLILPGEGGRLEGAVFGMGDEESSHSPLLTGTLARQLPAGRWRIAGNAPADEQALLGIILGGYSFTRYGKKDSRELSVELSSSADAARLERLAEATFLTRDLINTPTNDMGPEQLERAVRDLAARYDAEVTSIVGDDLLKSNFPMIHAVGRAAAQAPRLIDLRWGAEGAPRVTLVGKGVCFDTGGLDIKPASGMLLMKKDMGGAANVLGLASMIMAAGLKLRLRVLIPAVENAISANAFRPGDVLTSRSGKTVEIGNTDAEGRLILADALSLADEETPELLIDMATLTGAARVALGPDLPPFFTNDETFAGELAAASRACADPLWRLPLWKPYDAKLSSKVADFNNVTSDGFAGSVTAALFLQKFVEKARSWTHLDVYGWNPVDKPWCPVGGEAQGIRAINSVLEARYG